MCVAHPGRVLKKTGMGWAAMPLTWGFAVSYGANWTFFGILPAEVLTADDLVRRHAR